MHLWATTKKIKLTELKTQNTGLPLVGLMTPMLATIVAQGVVRRIAAA